MQVLLRYFHPPLSGNNCNNMHIRTHNCLSGAIFQSRIRTHALSSALVVTTEDVRNAVGSFQSGSAGGLDGLTPQHLKDLIGVGCGEARESLLRNLTALVNFMLSGKVVNEITDILYGANLCALKKKDGGIRPIAVGTVYRRLAAKCCCKKKAEDLKLYFQPNQLGFGSRGGCEAAVHALRTFLQHNGGDLVLKVDVKNAFNSVDRSALLSQIKDQIPDCYHFLWQCYSQNSKLIFQDNVIYSKTGCQQGDPLGPAIFSLAIHPIITRLKSKFNVWYLDDGTLGGEVDDVLEDFTILTKELKTIGLEINLSKCEYYISNTELCDLERSYSHADPAHQCLRMPQERQTHFVNRGLILRSPGAGGPL
ncbi:hypothetical protein K1T71_010166 [Dendrolimus kikuchii]|uniref:Uncharacterized protein n=1 Tax=Dendrolimus kikuchii TaxID=765133 RepID=A0ACC1CRI2_9NEOP|nr:hypothetical protein K1T71_010166 [Dendrolimus kikuchii]